MEIPVNFLHMGRVLHEDGDFITLEIAKHDDVAFTLDEETPDRFFTVMFVNINRREFWIPWEEKDDSDSD